MSRPFLALVAGSAALALSLICLNVVGLCSTLRHFELGARYPNQIDLTGAEALHQFRTSEFSSPRERVRRVTELVEQTMALDWPTDPAERQRYNVTIPPHENYLLALGAALGFERCLAFEFTRAEPALDRGIGFCSQHSLAVVDLLQRAGVPARMVALDGHVVATAQVDPDLDLWWVLDPSFGAVIEADLPTIEANPELVRSAYADHELHGMPIETLIDRFGASGNRVFLSSFGYLPENYVLERAALVGTWVVPALLLTPALLFWLLRRRGTSSRLAP